MSASPSTEVRRAGGVTMVIGSPSQLGIVVSPRAPKTTAAMIADHPDVVAAIDGPMFEKCNGQPSGYETYSCGVVEYAHLDVAEGVNVQSRHPERGITIGVVGESAYAVRGGIPRTGSRVAVQLYPSMVFDGANEGSTSRDLDRTIRAAVGILQDGRMFLAVAPSLGIRAMADALISMGAQFAGYADGGGSGALYASAPRNSTDVRYNLGGRRVITWVTFQNRSAIGSLISQSKSTIENTLGMSIPVPSAVLLAGAVALIVGGCLLLVARE